MRQLAIILSVLATSCTPHMKGPQFHAIAPPAGTGIVYVYRPSKARRAIAASYVIADGRANVVPNGAIAGFALTPGTHVMVFGEANGSSFAFDDVVATPGVHQTSLSVEVRAGETTYVRLVADDPPRVAIEATPDTSNVAIAPGGVPRPPQSW